MIGKEVLIDKILEDNNIQLAIEYLSRKKVKPGRDGIGVSKISEYWADNKDNIKASIFNKNYETGIAYQFEHLDKSGKIRKVIQFNLVDKLIARATVQVLETLVDCRLSNRCYGYRLGKGTKDVAEFSAKQMEYGNEWVAVIDVSDFFGSISHEMLFDVLKHFVADDIILNLIKSFVCCQIENEEGCFRMAKGLLQGLAISPMLSNIFMHDIDCELETTYNGYCRYGDDIRIYLKTKNEAKKAVKLCQSLLQNKGLSCNEKKCGTFMAINKTCLGYEFINKSGHILFFQKKQQNRNVYHIWQESAVKKIEHDYHIIKDGILTKKDFLLLFENADDTKCYLPVEVINSISIYSNVTFSSGFFNLANENGFSISFIDKYGKSVGRYIPNGWRRSINMEILQIQKLSDEKGRFELAKIYQLANVFNLRAVLRYYERRSDDIEISKTIDGISEIIDKIKKSSVFESLMIYEAQARQKYYHCFNYILSGTSFRFEKRTKRPPRDALNAMISFGNTLLYTRFANFIYYSSLDIRIGILHSSYKRAENLNLDLADLFKPVLVDRTIFTLINRHMINEIQDFEQDESGGVFLTDRGKRIFIQEFENKLASKVLVNDVKMSYEELMKKEVKKLEQYYNKGVRYKPYKYVN